jgi:hypothetical protein
MHRADEQGIPSQQRITSTDAAGARRLQRISGYATERIGAITTKQRGGKPGKRSTEAPHHDMHIDFVSPDLLKTIRPEQRRAKAQ